MKKLLTVIGLFAILIASTSAIETKPAVARVGYQAPNFIIHTGNGEMSLQQYRGHSFILTLWSSADAESRLRNIRDAREAKRLNVKHVSVNLDQSKELCKAVSRIDNVKSVYCPKRDRKSIVELWGVNPDAGEGMSSWMIGADGTIREMRL